MRSRKHKSKKQPKAVVHHHNPAVPPKEFARRLTAHDMKHMKGGGKINWGRS